MGTTQKTQQTSQFAPAGLQTYNAMLGPGMGGSFVPGQQGAGSLAGSVGSPGQPSPPMGAGGPMGFTSGGGGGLGNVTAGFINNPYGNAQFGFERMLGQQNANVQNQTNMNQLGQNFAASGTAGGIMSPAFQEMMNNQMRANTQNSALQGFINPTALANQRQQGAMNLAANFRPLQTGQTQVQSTSGLGTWLPQIAGAALGGVSGLGGLFNHPQYQSPWAGGTPTMNSGFYSGANASPVGWAGSPGIVPSMESNYVPGGTAGGWTPWMQPGTPG